MDVLIVEQNELLATVLADALADEGIDAAVVPDDEEALTRLRGFAGFSVRHPLPINELAGKVCTTAGGE